VAKGTPGKATPGTDYFAMIRAEELTEKYGIPVFNIHTHHPIGGDMRSRIAEPNKSPANLAPEYPQPRIDLVVPTPNKMSNVIVAALAPEFAQPLDSKPLWFPPKP
jgi:hypothetical protein